MSLTPPHGKSGAGFQSAKSKADMATLTLGRQMLMAGMALLCAAGFAAGGWLAGRGVLQARLGDRQVTVKGVAEIDAVAGMAVMPISIVVAGGDLVAAKQELDRQGARAIGFLKDRGVADDEIVGDRVTVTDSMAEIWRQTELRPESRYVLIRRIDVRSRRIELVSRLGREADALISDGIALTRDHDPYFVFTADQLNQVKPDLIRRATAAAHDAAAEFARTAGSRVGKIRRASQGVITVQARNPASTVMESRVADKRIRAVATVDFFLED